MNLPQYICDCGYDEFEVYGNEYEFRFTCTRCQNTIFERLDEND